MTGTAIQNALTPGEWHTATLWHAGKMIGGTVRGAVVLSLSDDRRHAAAALALYGQPYGFTREDVAALRALYECGCSCGVITGEDHTRWNAAQEQAPITLAKLAALLPSEGL